MKHSYSHNTCNDQDSHSQGIFGLIRVLTTIIVVDRGISVFTLNQVNNDTEDFIAGIFSHDNVRTVL